MPRISGAWLGLFLLFTVALRVAPAQVLYGSAVGTLQDASGGVVAWPSVNLTNKSTGTVREAVRLGGPLHIPQPVAGPVRTKGHRYRFPRVHSNERRDFLPLSAYRNFQNLVNLVPGATPANFQNSVGSTPARSLTTNINGTARNSNNARVDGATNVYIWLPHHMAYVPPVEAISTVSISTGSFDAEQGMAGGAAVTVATRSGTNDLHGSAFHFHDNHRLRTRKP